MVVRVMSRVDIVLVIFGIVCAPRSPKSEPHVAYAGQGTVPFFGLPLLARSSIISRLATVGEREVVLDDGRVHNGQKVDTVD